MTDEELERIGRISEGAALAHGCCHGIGKRAAIRHPEPPEGESGEGSKYGVGAWQGAEDEDHDWRRYLPKAWWGAIESPPCVSRFLEYEIDAERWLIFRVRGSAAVQEPQGFYALSGEMPR